MTRESSTQMLWISWNVSPCLGIQTLACRLDMFPLGKVVHCRNLNCHHLRVRLLDPPLVDGSRVRLQEPLTPCSHKTWSSWQGVEQLRQIHFLSKNEERRQSTWHSKASSIPYDCSAMRNSSSEIKVAIMIDRRYSPSTTFYRKAMNT